MRYSTLSRIGVVAALSALPTVAFAQQAITIQHIRPTDQRGINVFETPKEDTVTFTGTKISWGGAFRQDFQGIAHSNTALPRLVNNVDQNKLITIGHGFNNAVANLYLNAQLAKGIRVAMTSYLSARHHNETWVKDGYLLVDDSPINNPLLNELMSHLTLKVGHFEINYGDQHFRRTDNGLAMYNPFVGNAILDAFTTEVGAEAYVHDGWWLAMVGATNGEVRGTILTPGSRGVAYEGKLGIDTKLDQNIRFRLTGSTFLQDHANSQTLYGGDRGGSPFYDVVESQTSTETGNAWSGQIRNPFTNKVHAFVVNPFVKVQGLELFGNIEQAKGNNNNGTTTVDASDRTWNQYLFDGLYRFMNDQFYVGGRYNTASGTLAGITPLGSDKVGATRYEFGGGWFVTPNILAKAEWVNQKYNNFPTSDIRNGGKFNGFMIQGVVGF